MAWTDERVAVLKKMWGEGKTAADTQKDNNKSRQGAR